MSKINLKTDYQDGQILHGDELNINNNVTMLGVNDNFARIQNLQSLKADATYVDNELATKADVADLNSRFAALDALKADKTALANKADQSEVALKANQSYVDAQLATKSNQSYVDAQLATKVDVDDYIDDMAEKEDKSTIGNLNNLTTTDKTSIVNAINSIDVSAKAIATVSDVGVVKPDGTTITVDQDGTIHSVGGGGGSGGSSNYNELSNKPTIENVELKNNVTLNDIGAVSQSAFSTAMSAKANKDDVYTKNYIDANIEAPLDDKADKSYVDSQLQTKANTNDVYNKTAIDNIVDSVEASFGTLLDNKADKSTTYTKTEVNNLVDDKADDLSYSNNQLQLTSGGVAIGNPVTIQATGNEVVISNNPPQNNDWKLWVNNGEVQNIGSEVVNSLEGNEINLAPSVKAVNDTLKYSTTEIDTGKKWIDGKSIYRKVVVLEGNISSDGSVQTINIPHGISDLKEVTDIKAHFGNTNPTYNIPIYWTSTHFAFIQRVTSTNVVFITQNENWVGNNFYFVLEYTKTTD